MKVLTRNFAKVYNWLEEVDFSFTLPMINHRIMHEIAELMSISELSEFLFRVSWNKDPGSNKLSPTSIKMLNENHKLKLLTYEE